MKKKVFISVTAVVCLVIVSAFLYFFIPTSREILLQAENAFNLEDKEMLAGWAENIFTAEIIKVIGTKPDDVSPVTTYEAEVIENLKGILNGNVTISHRIGYSRKQRATIKFPGDTVLSEGGSYLIISRYDELTDSYWLVPVHGNIQLEKGLEKQLVDFYKEKVKNQKAVIY